MTKNLSFFVVFVVPFEKKEKIPLCNVFVCARSLLFFIVMTVEIYNGDLKMKNKKNGVIFVLVSVFISLIKELSSLLECHARILCLFFAICKDGFFPSPPFKRKKRRRRGEKQASCNYVLLYCSCAHIFCM